MKLNTKDIKEMTLGASSVSGKNGKVRFHRFTEQEALFTALRLHPKDEGFDAYFKNLSKRIGEIVKCR